MSDGARFSQRRILGALALLGALRLMTLVPAVIDDDEGFFAASANALHGPRSFFRAALDDKPPGTVWFDEAVRWFTGPMHLAQWSRFAGLIVLALTAWGVARIARRLSDANVPGVEAATALAFLLGTGAFSPKLFALTNEQLMLAPIVAAIWLSLEPRAGPRWLRAVLAGVSLGVATWIKQTAVVFALPLLVATEGVGAIALGFVAFVVTAYAGAWAVGVRDYWLWTFTYPREVLVAARRTLFTGLSDGLQNAALFAFAIVPLLIKAWRGRTRVGPQRARWVVWSWLAASLLAVGAGSGLFTHYFLLLVPPLAVLAGLELAIAPLSRWGMAWVAAAYVGCAIAATLPLTNLFWGNDLPYFQRVAERMRTLTAKDDRVFLWGGNPVPLALSGRRNATRFVTSRFVVEPYANAETLRLFRDELLSAPPELIVDLHARGDDRQNLPPDVLPWLAELLAHRYRVWADPALPWARFYVRDDRAASGPPRGLCASAALPDAEDGYPRSLEKLKQAIAQVRTGTRPPDPPALDAELRADFSLEILATSCPALPKFEPAGPASREIIRDHFAQEGFSAPLALEPLWWVELAIVEMQPVIRPRSH